MTDDKIVSLVKVKSSPPVPVIDDLQEDIINILETLLERAKKGDVTGLAFIADVKDDLTIETGFYARKVFKALGGLKVLEAELLETIE